MLVCIVAWAYLAHVASEMASAMDPSMPGMPGMPGMPMADMAMAVPRRSWLPAEFVLTCVMWAVMMVGMMAPAALPVLLVFATSRARRATPSGPTTLPFALGYLTVWIGFSACATVAQWALSQAALLSPEMAVPRPLSGVLLAMAGLYQLSPAKHRCLDHCQSPIGFLMSHWRDGAGGAFTMGLRHGLYCLGCCWALMAVLFVVGVMNLVMVGLLAVFILAERIGGGGKHVARWGGVAMAGAGLGIVLFAVSGR